MPVYDTVLGARLDPSGVADRAAAEAVFERAAENDSDRSASDRQRELDALAQIPGVKAELVLESEEGGRYYLVIEGGKQHAFEIHDSRVPGRVEPPHGKMFPALRTKGPADDLIELLQEAGVGDVEWIGDYEVQLPYSWPDRDTLLATLAQIGPMVHGDVKLLAEIDERRFDVEVSKGRVTCVPLHPVCGEHTPRVLALASIEAQNDVVIGPLAAPPKPKPVPKHDPMRPLVTGSARQREDAWGALTDYGRKRVELAPIIAAVRDEANHDQRFDELRRKIYHYLAKYDTPDVCALWLWALREESDEVAATVTYIGWRLDSVIAKLPDELREAEARGDDRTASRIRKLQAEAR